MFAKIDYPQQLLPSQQDAYLSRGWFRMRQTIFTTNFLQFNNRFFSAVWLRVALQAMLPDKKFRELQKKNVGFITVIQPAGSWPVSIEHEQLFSVYRQSLPFEISASLQELLYGIESHNRFPTYEINVYDGPKLIAAGFFDMGHSSAAGISCIYDPAYKKYSLGKYLMYQKMFFCKEKQMDFFYPGYVVPRYDAFNYKLEVARANLQYLELATGNWLALPVMESVPDPLQHMVERLDEVRKLLLQQQKHAYLFYYRFFEANLDPYYISESLFDFPVFLYLGTIKNTSSIQLIVYDVRDAMFHLLTCTAIVATGPLVLKPPVFDVALLRLDNHHYTSASAADFTRSVVTSISAA